MIKYNAYVIMFFSMVVFFGCTTLITEEKLFKQKTLSIQTNATVNMVEEVMGKPDFVYNNDNNKLLSRLGSDKVCGYFHPYYATISFVIGYKSNKVNKIAIYDASGTATSGPIIGRLEKFEDFWLRRESPSKTDRNKVNDKELDAFIDEVLKEKKNLGNP